MSDELKRIDPKAIPDLFKKHGFMPITELFYVNPGGLRCGCVNTILAVDAVGADHAISVADLAKGTEDAKYLAELSGLNSGYAVGLARGWDSNVAETNETAEEAIGFADGHAAWVACQDTMETYDDRYDDDCGED
jgi:hypothetical protein